MTSCLSDVIHPLNQEIVVNQYHHGSSMSTREIVEISCILVVMEMIIVLYLKNNVRDNVDDSEK